MAKNDFEFMEALEVPTEGQFEDSLRILEDEAHDIYVAQYERSEISAQDCEVLFHNWMMRYRGNYGKRPSFDLPKPGQVGGSIALPTEAS